MRENAPNNKKADRFTKRFPASASVLPRFGLGQSEKGFRSSSRSGKHSSPMSAPAEPQLTPMMAQYRRIKSELPADALLLFRLGDFYELFFEDAQTGAQILNVTLTKRGVIPMCGIPYHAANGYIARILRAGRKVAICDQTEEARPGQLVKREVTAILSPGTHFDERLLSAERNNFLAAVAVLGKRFGLALVDLTTSDFKVTEVEGEQALLTELERVRPAEIIYPGANLSLKTLLQGAGAICLGFEDWVFLHDTALFTVREHFKVASLDGFGLRNRPAAIGAAGAVLHYLSQHLRRDVSPLVRLQAYEHLHFLALDGSALRSLEILEPQRHDAARNTSLFGALNRTVTPMGARKLRDWLSQPLADVEAITRRQDAVETWLANPQPMEEFRALLREVRDLERTISRLGFGSGNARDLLGLKGGLERLPPLRRMARSVGRKDLPEPQPDLAGEWEPPEEENPRLLSELANQIQPLPDVVELIGRAITDEPPLALKEGGLIRDGFSPDLDELRSASRNGKEWIAQLQQREMERTGISSLKIRFTAVFGYFIEITRANLEKVPADYTRKQTVANAERFITPELKEMECKILVAEERSMKLEYELFQQVREGVLKHLAAIQITASALAQLDVLASFAEIARLFDYCKPFVADEGVMLVRDGRHPVLEQQQGDERFVPNDVHLDVNSQQIAIITGPNMAGKSTYIRQVALLALMAHAGSFVPAREARIDLVDRIFTRIGASDDLARGQSTFMVEMTETAAILNNATRRSLLILDEIGRGTSTFDGLSLAWSIVEFIHNQLGARTLFASHYHELTELAGRLKRVRNYNVAVREWNDQIVFLRKIVEGGSDKSYGIHVARIAGAPKSVVERAKEILLVLEEAELNLQNVAGGDGTAPSQPRARVGRPRAEREKLKRLAEAPQMDLFS